MHNFLIRLNISLGSSESPLSSLVSTKLSWFTSADTPADTAPDSSIYSALDSSLTSFNSSFSGVPNSSLLDFCYSSSAASRSRDLSLGPASDSLPSEGRGLGSRPLCKLSIGISLSVA